jgi:Ca-activated chloride channel family protein
MRRVGALLLLLALGGWKPLKSKNPDVEEGNRLLAAGKLDEAEAAYRRAEKTLPDDFGLRYDLGTLFHERAQSEEDPARRPPLRESAEKEYRLATESPQADLKSRAHYNLGNLQMDRGFEAQDPQQQVGRFKAAVDEYKRALRVDPRNEDARRNLELALRYVQKPPPPPPQKQPQKEPKPDQKPQDGQKPPEQQPQPQSGNEDKQPEEQKPEEQKNPPQDENPEEGKADPPPQAKEDPKPEGKPKPPAEPKTSDEIEERKLDALERRSKDLQIQRQRLRMPESRRGRPVKDW